jgi:hypothetical protein
MAEEKPSSMPPKIGWWDIIKAYKWKGAKFNGEIGKIVIKYDDIFHLKNLYKMIYQFLDEQGFEALNGGGKFYEDYYLEKHTGGMLEYWFYWYTQKPINNYYRYILNVNYHCLALSKVKIQYQGKELGMHKGEVAIEIDAKVDTDFKKEWQKHSILKHFKEGYDRLIFYHELNNMEWMNLYRIVYRLQALIKAYLNVRTLAPVHAMLHPPAEGTEGRWPTIEE